jgi:NMD protein affecting ribosome stability and mRNA decay
MNQKIAKYKVGDLVEVRNELCIVTEKIYGCTQKVFNLKTGKFRELPPAWFKKAGGK